MKLAIRRVKIKPLIVEAIQREGGEGERERDGEERVGDGRKMGKGELCR